MSIESISSSGAAASSMREVIAAPRSFAAPVEDAAIAATPADTASAADAPQGGAQAQPTREEIDGALRQLHEAMPYEARNLLFSVDHDTGRTIVRVVDATTKELIVQIPSKELLALTKSLDKLAGLFVKDQV